MAQQTSQTARENVKTALELLDVAERMLRRRLRREHPHLTEEAIEQRIVDWYQHRPGAELGDGMGVIGPWPRQRTQ
ncbi:MAG TPA: hypothetical protein VFQ61_35725 [Polyangiaceae bacterium]|nr:hypothetical protein [Polyangiaceae bacterium]